MISLYWTIQKHLLGSEVDMIQCKINTFIIVHLSRLKIINL